jgi:Holliday junction resolvase
MNKAEKGRRFELEIKKILENKGYLVWRTTRTKFGANDLFGMFDLCAVKAHDGSVRLFFIQATHESMKSKKLNDLREFLMRYPIHKLDGVTVYLAVKHKAKWVGRGKNKEYRKATIEFIPVHPGASYEA